MKSDARNCERAEGDTNGREKENSNQFLSFALTSCCTAIYQVVYSIVILQAKHDLDSHHISPFDIKLMPKLNTNIVISFHKHIILLRFCTFRATIYQFALYTLLSRFMKMLAHTAITYLNIITSQHADSKYRSVCVRKSKGRDDCTESLASHDDREERRTFSSLSMSVVSIYEKCANADDDDATTKNMEILFHEIVWLIFVCVYVQQSTLFRQNNTYTMRLNSIDLGNKMHTLNKYVFTYGVSIYRRTGAIHYTRIDVKTHFTIYSVPSYHTTPHMTYDYTKCELVCDRNGMGCRCVIKELRRRR